MKEIKIKKPFINKVFQDFQSEFHVVFRDATQAKNLIEYAIAKFIIQSNQPKQEDKRCENCGLKKCFSQNLKKSTNGNL